MVLGIPASNGRFEIEGWGSFASPLLYLFDFLVQARAECWPFQKKVLWIFSMSVDKDANDYTL